VGVGEKDIATALKLDARSGEVLWAKAEIEEAQGQTDQALADAKKALQLRPGLRDATELIQRLAPDRLDERSDVIVGAAAEPWRVVRRGAQFQALNDALPRLSVPMEMLSDGTPRVIAWEEKPAPHEAFGVLRFTAGTLRSARGAEEVEMAALIDLAQQKVVTVVPEKQGVKTATWSFEDSRISVAAVDGLTEEFALNSGDGLGALAGAGAGLAAGAGTRRLSARPYAPGGAWAPWNQPFGMPNAGPGPSSKPAKSAQRRKKPKSFFELLFN
jgi:hypothetical protein